MGKTEQKFWETKSFEEMTQEEWESLCDGCGRCCLLKLEDENTNGVLYTSVACRHLSLETCRCKCYENRVKAYSECLVLTPYNIEEYTWLPTTCSYRRLAEGRGLEEWHHLVTGDTESVHDAGISVRDKVISEKYIKMEDLEAYILNFEI
jgi:uncharacterized cysteine cluster protein YcgN (CxxCxxCC family)